MFTFMVHIHGIFRELYSPEIVSSNYILFCTSQLNLVLSLIHYRPDALDGQAVANVEFLWRMSHSEEGDQGDDANAQIKQLVSSMVQQCFAQLTEGITSTINKSIN